MRLADSLEKRTTALTVSDIAELLHISERQVYKLAASNRIPSFKVGGSIRFDPADFTEWLREKMIYWQYTIRNSGGSSEKNALPFRFKPLAWKLCLTSHRSLCTLPMQLKTYSDRVNIIKYVKIEDAWRFAPVANY